MKLFKTLLFLALFSISFISCNDLEDDNETQRSLITDSIKATGVEMDIPVGSEVEVPDGSKDATGEEMEIPDGTKD